MAWISPTERIVIVACIVDAADKALLPATLRSLQHALGAGPAALGMLSFYQNIAYSLALPLWGLALAHGHDAADLLALGCVGFGMVTVALALSSSYALHCALRCLNGAFLCGIVPLGQAILVQIVAEDARGRAFGRLQAASALASLLTFAFCTSSSSTAWRSSYIAIGVASMGVGWFVRCSMPRCSAGAAQHVVGLSTSRKEGTLQRARSSARKILQIPSFVLLVLQGITGGVPWNAMNFLPLYWLTIGYSDSDAGLLGAAVQAGFIAGSLVGGRVGDAWAKKSSDYGRAFTAQLSVSLGIPAFAAIFFLVPREPGNFGLAAFALFVFGSVATWVGVAANRPICADLVSTPAEQGQIVALWVMLEGVSSSIFGSPLVGLLSEGFGYSLVERSAADSQAAHAGEGVDPIGSTKDAAALAKALVGVSTLAWGLCLATWVAMLWTLPKDRARAAASRSAAEEMQLLKP